MLGTPEPSRQHRHSHTEQDGDRRFRGQQLIPIRIRNRHLQPGIFLPIDIEYAKRCVRPRLSQHSDSTPPIILTVIRDELRVLALPAAVGILAVPDEDAVVGVVDSDGVVAGERGEDVAPVVHDEVLGLEGAGAAVDA